MLSLIGATNVSFSEKVFLLIVVLNFSQVLHEDSGIVLDTSRALQIAADVARAMQFIHSLDRQLPRYHLNSKHIMVILISFYKRKCSILKLLTIEFTSASN